ncbi:MAG: hypothetical protein NVS3B10_23690 [Polyangiales bacterium]
MRHALATWSILGCACLGGCGYPSFGFSPADSGTDEVTSDASDGGADAVRDTAVVDGADAADTFGPVDTALGGDSTSDVPADVPADTVDSAAPPDTADAADSADAAAPLAGGCTGVHAFCQDFDGAGLGSPYGFDSVGGIPGNCALDGTRTATAPRSMLCSVPTSTLNPNNGFAIRRLTGPSSTALTRIDADLFLEVDKYPASNATLFKVQRWSDGHGVGLSLRSTGAAIEARGATTTTWSPLPVALPTGRWFHFRLEARLQIAGGSFAVFVDDMTTPVLSRTGVSTIDVEGPQRELFNGLWVDDVTATDLRVGYDDVSVDFFP